MSAPSHFPPSPLPPPHPRRSLAGASALAFFSSTRGGFSLPPPTLAGRVACRTRQPSSRDGAAAMSALPTGHPFPEGLLPHPATSSRGEGRAEAPAPFSTRAGGRACPRCIALAGGVPRSDPAPFTLSFAALRSAKTRAAIDPILSIPVSFRRIKHRTGDEACLTQFQDKLTQRRAA